MKLITSETAACFWLTEDVHEFWAIGLLQFSSNCNNYFLWNCDVGSVSLKERRNQALLKVTNRLVRMRREWANNGNT